MTVGYDLSREPWPPAPAGPFRIVAWIGCGVAVTLPDRHDNARDAIKAALVAVQENKPRIRHADIIDSNDRLVANVEDGEPIARLAKGDD